MGDSTPTLLSFPPLSREQGSSQGLANVEVVHGNAHSSAAPGGGSWREKVGFRKSLGKLTYYPDVVKDGIVSPPVELLHVGAKSWSNALVGFFWSKRLAFPLMNAWARAKWGKKGRDIGVRALAHWRPALVFEAMVTWMEYWTLEGLSHFARGIGKLICMDTPTAAMDRIGYAKICVEVAKDVELPDMLSILRLSETGEMEDLLSEDRGMEEQGHTMGQDTGPGCGMSVELRVEGSGRSLGFVGAGDPVLMQSRPRTPKAVSEQRSEECRERCIGGSSFQCSRNLPIKASPIRVHKETAIMQLWRMVW
ncbi:hypothetical protein K2173_014672 [Erythroxylum novogranatense]|uniref:Uncharacterized protein n=1 Tax=Erythroxylum novogranatense TaxID=1862640 RepID=A0AAV8TFE5_9ROSI|nr:hypothetical protein K2173_014672 [Erythroxylum novogranatense]